MSNNMAKIKPLIHLRTVQRPITLPFLFAQSQGRTNGFEQHQVVPRLRDEIERTGLHPFHRQGDRAPSRHQDYRHIRTEHLDLTQQPQSLLSRRGHGEVHVHQDQLRDLLTHTLDSLLRLGGRLRLKARMFQQEGQRRTNPRIIIDNQYHTFSLFYRFTIASKSASKLHLFIKSYKVALRML